MVGVWADPVTAQVMMTLRAGMGLLLGRAVASTMRTGVASSETVLRQEPVVKVHARPVEQSVSRISRAGPPAPLPRPWLPAVRAQRTASRAPGTPDPRC